MCMICVDYQKGILSFEEAILNTEEMSNDDPHKLEIMNMLIDEIEKPFDELD